MLNADKNLIIYNIMKEMRMKPEAPDYIRSIKPYKPGKPIEELEREYGVKNSVKLASNENPLGPSPRAMAAMQAAMGNLHRYPDGSGYYLTTKLAEKLAMPPDRIVLGNGSDDVIGMLARAYLRPGDEAVMTVSSFLMYEIFVRSVDAVPVFVPLRGMAVDLPAMLARITPRTRMVFINNPLNPTGSYITRSDFERFMDHLPEHVIVVLDEAYIEFARAADCLDGLALIAEERPLALLRTFSKAYGLAGLRIGYGVMPGDMAAILNRIRQPFNTSLLAQAGAAAALDDDPFLHQTRELVHKEIDFMQAAIRNMGLSCYPTQANFFLIDVRRDAGRIFDAMLKKGVIVRAMTSYGYPSYIRVNAGLHEENQRFLDALAEVLASEQERDPA
jgi:histidinol-phosphate aminotransferase